MIERGILAGAAAIIVGAVAWWLIAITERERARVEALLGLAQRHSTSRMTASRLLRVLGRALPGRVARALVRGRELGTEDRGVAVLIALAVGAAALAVHPLLIAALPASPWLATQLSRWTETRAARARRRSIEHDVPPAIDILVLALEAGLPFDRAIAAYTENVTSELTPQLQTTIRELEIGYRRREALDRMVARTQSRNLRALAGAVRLSEEFGTPLAPALRSLATQLRAERRQRLHEAALRAPVTMLLPTAGLILLPIFAIILGPIALRVATGSLF